MAGNDGAAAQPPLRMALIGMTGVGKSSLGNRLLGRQEFAEAEDPNIAQTTDCARARATVDGRSVTIVDSPGTIDTREGFDPLQEIPKVVSFCPDGFHAFLLVMRIDEAPTSETMETIQQLRNIFTESIFPYTVIAFTRGDRIGNDEKKFRQRLQQWRQSEPEFRDLLDFCSSRTVLVDLSGSAEQPSDQLQEQLRWLLNTVDSLDGRTIDDRDLWRAVRRTGRGQELWTRLRENRQGILICGGAGFGKSSLANALLETDAFAVSDGSVSFQTQRAERFFMAKMVTVVDSPGNLDGGQGNELHRAALGHSSGFHAILLVVKSDANLQPTRKVFQQLQSMFQQRDLARALTIVFTHGDAVSEETHRRRLESNKRDRTFAKMLQLSHGRHLLVDASDSSLQAMAPQMERLRQLMTNAQPVRVGSSDGGRVRAWSLALALMAALCWALAIARVLLPQQQLPQPQPQQLLLSAGQSAAAVTAVLAAAACGIVGTNWLGSGAV